MLRELSQVLAELHDGLAAVQTHGHVRLSRVEMTLPMELRPVFANGGCILLADLPRSHEVNEWLASPSKLRLSWNADGGRSEGEAS